MKVLLLTIALCSTACARVGYSNCFYQEAYGTHIYQVTVVQSATQICALGDTLVYCKYGVCQKDATIDAITK
jgi:hypothetical protein